MIHEEVLTRCHSYHASLGAAQSLMINLGPKFKWDRPKHDGYELIPR